ncbi:MAG TPA: pectate lyase, partial [Polyangiaceae bacterium]
MHELTVSELSRAFLTLAGAALVTLTGCEVGSVVPNPDSGTAGTTSTVTGGSSSGGSGGSATGGSSSAAVGGGGTSAVSNCSPAAVPVTVPWSSINEQAATFYATPEALTLAGNIVFYQNSDHGWPKNTDMTTRTGQHTRSTIDNSATTTQIQYLSRVFEATGCTAFRDAAVNG